MMRQVMFAAAAALALAACNPTAGSGPAMPTLQAGATAPSTQTPPAQAVPQTTVTDEVRTQLIANIGEQLTQIQANFAAGMAPPAGFTDVVVPMQPSTDHRFLIDLTAANAYTFIGACDGDCTNVDIELIDMTTGGVVASDMLADDYPVVNFVAPANGSYMVRLLMQTCTMAPCYAGARALTQAAGAEAPK